MRSAVYLLEGEGVPPKLAVVAHDLEIDTLFSIANRSRSGALYQRAAAIDSGIFQGNDSIHDAYDQAWYTGRDTATFIGGGANHEVAGAIEDMDDEVDGPRSAWMLSQSNLGKMTNLIVVLPYRNCDMAEDLATSYLRDYFAAADASARLIVSGTFSLSASIVAPCARVRLKRLSNVEAHVGQH